jgi:hypothetical protein
MSRLTLKFNFSIETISLFPFQTSKNYFVNAKIYIVRIIMKIESVQRQL